MNQLFPELLGEIGSHLNDMNDINHFSLTCYLWYTMSKPYMKAAYVKHFITNVPEEMIRAIGIKNFESYPILTIKTHNDDQYNVSPDMMCVPIMIGVDPYKRRFICIRYKCRSKTSVVTLFQRYTDSPYSWCGCGHFNFDYIFDRSYGSAINYEWLKSLVEGKETTMTILGVDKVVKII